MTAAAVLLASLALAGPALATVTAEFSVIADSMLRAGDRNTNEGINPVLALSGSGNTRIVLDFVVTVLPVRVQAGPNQVFLCLQAAENHGNWGASGKAVTVHFLETAPLVSFIEGNGKTWGLPPSQQVRGSGPGVTWNCPADTQIGNSATNCTDGWAGGEFEDAIAPAVTITDETGTGPTPFDRFVVFDITAWIKDPATPPISPLRFLVKKVNDGAPGWIDFYSREGALAAGAPSLFTPRVVIGGSYGTPAQACQGAPG